MCKCVVCRNLSKILVFLLICVILYFSKGVISKAMELNEQVFYADIQNLQSLSEHSKVLEVEIKKTTSCKTEKPQKSETKTVKRSNSSKDEQTKKVFLYHLLCIAYICVLGITITTLLIILLKDDSGIRYEKLDELNEIKEKFFKEDFKNPVDKTEKEVKVVNSNMGTTTSKTKTKTKTTETTDNRVKLLKHYMSCVADI